MEKKDESTLLSRERALMAVYAMATTYNSTPEAIFDQVVLSITTILNVPFTSLGIFENNNFSTLSRFYKGEIGPASRHSHACPSFQKMLTLKEPYQWSNAQMNNKMCGLCIDECGFLSYIGVPVLGAKGDLLGVICSADTKPRLFTESEIQLIEIFARYVSHEIASSRMTQQLTLAHSMNVIGRIAAGVAHEVRNPLNAILAISEALFAEIGNTPNFAPYISHIRTQVGRLSSLMQDLLELGRPLPLDDMQRMEIGVILKQTIEAWTQSHPTDTRLVDLSIPEDCLHKEIKVSHHKIQQAFFNLIENSADHSQPDTRIDITCSTDSSTFIIVRVIDSGKGIQPEYLGKVFEPFFTTRKSGTGLGLAIVKHIVGLHGGAITLYNNETGTGATAEVSLPLA